MSDESPWIAVSDQEPRIGRYILVTDGRDVAIAARFPGYMGVGDGRSWYFNSKPTQRDVTHWMPLPPLPTETA